MRRGARSPASACSTKPSTKPKRIRAQTRGRFPCWTRVCRKRRRAHPNPRGAGARCQRMMHRIGEDISEQLHIPPRQVWVWQHVRFKYGCRQCERHEIRAPVVRAEMPARPLPGSVARAATIATVMTSKYADGLPLYRMEQVFHRAGIQIGRGTMGHWLIGASQRHLQRLYDAMHHVLLTQPLIHGDETTLQV